jgi:hypothetical protein
MLYRKEYMEQIIRPKLMTASEKSPKSMYDLCTKLGLQPDQVHTVRAWIRELNLDLTDVVTKLSSRARRMLATRYGTTVDATIPANATPARSSTITGTKTKKTSKFKGKKKGKKSTRASKGLAPTSTDKSKGKSKSKVKRKKKKVKGSTKHI